MAALVDFLPSVQSGLASAILAHLMFVTIHPFPDGNGRVGRLLMNAVLIGSGWPWLTIQEGERGIYFDALKEAQLNGDPRSFGRFIVQREAEFVRSFEDRG